MPHFAFKLPFTLVRAHLEEFASAMCSELESVMPAGAPVEPATWTKAISRRQIVSLAMGMPYPMLLYERFVARRLAGHRGSVSQLVGDSLEVKIEEVLSDAGISYRKTKRAERVTGFDQAPDFIVPDEFNPQVVIEAKIAEDDGTARDKITRVQHLAHLSSEGQPEGAYRYEVIACISGRGFGIRREDMKKLLLATRGKVFTLKTLDRLVGNTALEAFRTT